jgi:hypothetical protein
MTWESLGRVVYMFLLVVAVSAFTILFLQLHHQNRVISKDQQAICDTTNSFINSIIRARSVQNNTSIRNIIEHKQQNATIDALIRLTHDRIIKHPSEFDIALLAYVWNTKNLYLEQDQTIRRSIAAAKDSIDDWQRLRKKLECD